MLDLVESKKDQVIIHDINSSISALQGAFEVINDEWRNNPELIDRILPLTLDKIAQLQEQLLIFRQHST